MTNAIVSLRSRTVAKRPAAFPLVELDPEVRTDHHNLEAKRLADRDTRRGKAVIMWPTLIGAPAAFILTHGDPFAGLMGFAGGVLASTIGLNLLIIKGRRFYRKRTLALPSDMSVEMIERGLLGLAAALRDRIDADRLPALQRDVDDAGRVLTALMAKTPRRLLERGDAVMAPSSARDMADALSSAASRLSELTAVAGGADYDEALSIIRPLALLVDVSTVRLGLDGGVFAGPVVDDAPKALPQPAPIDEADPAARVRALGRRWLQGPRIGDDAVMPLADAAARDDIDVLEAHWRLARQNAVKDDVRDIDAEFADGCRILETRLQAAIANRSAMLRQNLSTGRRYLESKHGDAVD